MPYSEAAVGHVEEEQKYKSRQGASVVLGARRVDRIQSLADELTGSGGKALAVATVVTFVDADHNIDDQIDAAYRTKCRRYSASIISHIVSPEALTISMLPPCPIWMDS